MRGDNENGDLYEAAAGEGTVSCFLSPLPLQLFAVCKKNFLFRSGKARKSRGRNSAQEWHEETHNSCMSCVVK